MVALPREVADRIFAKRAREAERKTRNNARPWAPTNTGTSQYCNSQESYTCTTYMLLLMVTVRSWQLISRANSKVRSTRTHTHTHPVEHMPNVQSVHDRDVLGGSSRRVEPSSEPAIREPMTGSDSETEGSTYVILCKWGWGMSVAC